MGKESRQTLTNSRKPMANFKLHDAQDNAHDAVRDAFENDHFVIYEARGCDYEIEVTDTPDMTDGTEWGVVVRCHSYNGDRNGDITWSGCAGIRPDTRVIDAVRAARNSSNL